VSIRDYLELYRDRRLLVVFVFGAISGFPWVLIGSVMTAWLQEAGLTRSAIGFFGSIFVVYAFNFIWAPFLDACKIPFLSAWGRRRGWIFVMQLLLLLFVLSIAFTNPASNLLWTGLLALGIATASATQDVAIDAYRIEIIGVEESRRIPVVAAMSTCGWWTGYSLPGALALILSDRVGIEWKHVYLCLSLFIVAGMLFIYRISEPTASFVGRDKQRSLLDSIAHMIAQPFREFFQRNGLKFALALLLFVITFKIGEAFLGRMSIVFYKEIGFSNTDIGIYSKMIGWWVIIIFSLIASALNIRFGLVKGLMISGIAMAATNLMFSWIALVGPVKSLFAAAIIVDNFTASFATVAFVSFISYLTNRAYTATQYALLASLGNFGRTTLAAFSGIMVDYLDGNWPLFFLITALMVVPALLMLMLLAKRINHY
jgi:PAT family beta-lactamase induction signal transducer AmpG